MKKDFKPNERITTFFALESMEIRRSKKMNYFLLLNLHDRTGSIRGYLWTDPIETSALLSEKTYVKVRGITKLINDSIALEVEKIRTAEKEEIDIRDFLDVVPGGMDLWHNKLLGSVEQIKDLNCRQVVDAFLKDEGFLELFITSPAGKTFHHNYIGGLLEHTAGVMSQAALIADRNPALLDKDLILTGAFLHDIGKTREIYWELARNYTTEGKLLGHISIGVSLLEEKLCKIEGFPPDLALQLKHMMLSHHGELEFGSPVRPATPEALVLNLIDNTDAKISHLYCHLKNSNPNDDWSPHDRFLNRELYQRKFTKKEVAPIKEVAV